MIAVFGFVAYLSQEFYDKLLSRYHSIIETLVLLYNKQEFLVKPISVGYRLITLFSFVDYFSSASFYQLMFGEVFNFHSWIVDRYSYLGSSMIEEGDVTNLIANILSGGIVGALFFILFIGAILMRVKKARLYLLILFYLCAYGNLTSSLLFLQLLILDFYLINGSHVVYVRIVNF